MGGPHHRRPGGDDPAVGPRDRHHQAVRGQPGLGHPAPLEHGENQARTPMLLANLVGANGISGGGTGERESSANLGMAAFPVLTNPVRPVISTSSGPRRSPTARGGRTRTASATSRT